MGRGCDLAPMRSGGCALGRRFCGRRRGWVCRGGGWGWEKGRYCQGLVLSTGRIGRGLCRCNSSTCASIMHEELESPLVLSNRPITDLSNLSIENKTPPFGPPNRPVVDYPHQRKPKQDHARSYSTRTMHGTHSSYAPAFPPIATGTDAKHPLPNTPATAKADWEF